MESEEKTSVVCSKCGCESSILRDSYLASKRRHLKKNPEEPFSYLCHECAQNSVKIPDDFVYSFIDIDRTRELFGSPKNGKSTVYVPCRVCGPGCIGFSHIQLATLRFNIRKSSGNFTPSCKNCAFGVFPEFLTNPRVRPWVKYPPNVTLDSLIDVTCSVCNGEKKQKASSLKSVFDKNKSNPSWAPICVTCSNKDHFSATDEDIQSHVDSSKVHPNLDRVFIRCVSCGSESDIRTRSLANSIRLGKISGSKYEYKCFQCLSAGPNFVSLKELSHVVLSSETIAKFGKMANSRRDPVCARCEGCGTIQDVKLDSVLRTAWISRSRFRTPLYLCLSCASLRPETVERMSEVRNSQQRSRFRSGIESVTFRILESLNLKFESEHKIGPYNFDFYLPDFKCLIEVQGEYWHSLPKHIRNDRSKSAYIENHHPDLSILYLPERIFMNPNLVKDKILSFIDTEVPSSVDFDFKRVELRSLDDSDKYPGSKFPIWKDFLDSFHYARSGRSSKLKFGAFLDRELIAVVKFSSTTRDGTPRTLGLSSSQVLELDRLCIHPNYHKKNFASWLISRSSNFVFQNPEVRALVSFADPQSGHSGSVYKASNWDYFGKTSPSYEYISTDGSILHKKTAYERARSAHMKESEYASLHGLRKRTTAPKLKFVFRKA